MSRGDFRWRPEQAFLARVRFLWFPTMLVTLVIAWTGAAQPVIDFALPRRESGRAFRLSDFTGQIVVLDFSAYWCLPCRVASKPLGNEIQKFYAGRSGNPHGIPVRVISINIEKEHPELTDQFIATTGASMVLDDSSASVLKQFGAPGIPYLVVLDGSRARSNASVFSIVYAHAGYEGAAALRKVIDAIGGEPLPPGRTGAWLAGWSATPVTERLEADTEITWTSDMLLAESGVRFEQDTGRLRWDVNLNHNSYNEQYRHFKPADLFGFPADLHEDRYAGQATVRPKVLDSLTLILSGGAYNGFQDYRRVWLNNYYRQQFNNPLGPTPGYQEADPKGWNVSAGLRWEYLPARGFLEARGGYSVDDVVPGFVRNPATGTAVRGRSRLYTTSLSLSTENVLSSRLRALNELRLGDTTTRNLRISWQGSLNCALGERWVLRPYGGYTTEAPQFEAFWVGSALEFNLTRFCTLVVAGHYYRDTGEIVDPFALSEGNVAAASESSAAPGLESYQASLGVRFTWSRATVKLSLGPYFTSYEPLPTPSRAFTNLYRDRQWGLAQAAISVAF